MQQYLIRRLLLLGLTIVGVSIIIFVIMRIVPGDVAMAILAQGEGEGGTTEEDLARIRAQLGLADPLYQQYFKWVWGVVRLDLGESLWTGIDVWDQVKGRFPVTVQLAGMTLVLAIAIALVSGVLSALKQDTWVDYFFRIFTISGLALPAFWVGLLVILALVIWFNYFTALDYKPFWEDPWANFQQFIFPAVVLGWRSAAISGRIVRSSMLEVLREDYIRTARAKGLREGLVIGRHALRNAALPVVTIVGVQVAGLMSGVVVIEQVFSLPGLGRELVDGIYNRDYPVVQFLVVFFAGITVMSNLAVDVVYGWLDPRIRYG